MQNVIKKLLRGATDIKDINMLQYAAIQKLWIFARTQYILPKYAETISQIISNIHNALPTGVRESTGERMRDRAQRSANHYAKIIQEGYLRSVEKGKSASYYEEDRRDSALMCADYCIQAVCYTAHAYIKMQNVCEIIEKVLDTPIDIWDFSHII